MDRRCRASGIFQEYGCANLLGGCIPNSMRCRFDTFARLVWEELEAFDRFACRMSVHPGQFSDAVRVGDENKTKVSRAAAKAKKSRPRLTSRAQSTLCARSPLARRGRIHFAWRESGSASLFADNFLSSAGYERSAQRDHSGSALVERS